MTTDMKERPIPTTPEAEIDRNLDALANKILAGKASEAERVYFEQLASERTQMMQPRVVFKNRQQAA